MAIFFYVDFSKDSSCLNLKATYANLGIVLVGIEHDDRVRQHVDSILRLDLSCSSESAIRCAEGKVVLPGPDAK